MHRRTILLAAAVLPFVPACQSMDVQQTTTMNGGVETIAPTSRELLLRGDSGSQSGVLLSTIVGPQVQRLHQIRSIGAKPPNVPADW